MSPERARLFVAAVPPRPVLERLAAELARPVVPGVRYTDSDQWHVTLRFLGTTSVDEATTALAGLRAGVAEARLGPATVRLGPRVVCLAVAGLEALSAAVVAATGHVGRPPEQRPFTGHLTLARLTDRPVRRAPGPTVGAAVGGGAPDGADVVVGVPFEAAFEVREVHLVRSRTSRGGAVYDTVATRPLAVGGPAAHG